MSALRIVLVGYGPVGARFVEELLPPSSRSRRAHRRRRRARRGLQPRARRRVRGRQHRARRHARRRPRRRGGGRRPRARSASRRPRSTAPRASCASARARSSPTTASCSRPAPARTCRPSTAWSGTAATSPRSRSTRGSSSARDDELPEGITALRDLADAERVLEAVRARPPHHRARRRRARARARPRRGPRRRRRCASCTTAPHPMPRNLDRGGGQVLRAALRRTGITVIAHSRAEAVAFRTDDDGTAGSTCSSPPTASSCAATCSCSPAA